MSHGAGSPLRRVALLAALAGALGACAGGTYQPARPGQSVTKVRVVRHKAGKRRQTQPLIQYGARCYDLDARMERRRRAGKLLPIELRVRQSTSALLPKGGFIDERRLAEALRTGSVRTALIVGLGGVGKSTFAKALEAQVCDQLPTVRVDLNLDVARSLPKTGHTLAGPEPNAVLAAAAKALGVDPKERRGKVSAAARALGGGDWLLLLDSLDEVADAHHHAVLRAVRDALPQIPRARVLVFTRPPVATPLADLASIRNVVELEPQTCGGVQRTIATWAKKKPEIAELPAMLGRLGLDRRVRLGGRCAHPHLMTWRDLKLVTRLGRWRRKGHAQPWDKAYDGSRANLYRLWVLDTLNSGFDYTGRPAADLVRVLDAIAAHPSAHALDRALDVTQADCIRAATQRALQAPERFCRDLLRTRLFGDRHADGRIGFANQSVADWLIARRLDAELDALPAERRCEEVAQHDKRFRSSEIAAFFVGMPHGRACLYTVARALCSTRALQLDLVRTLERGLPWGRARTDAIARAHKLMKAAPHKEDACVRDLLSKIAKP